MRRRINLVSPTRKQGKGRTPTLALVCRVVDHKPDAQAAPRMMNLP
jgi:hypothetical protein